MRLVMPFTRREQCIRSETAHLRNDALSKVACERRRARVRHRAVQEHTNGAVLSYRRPQKLLTRTRGQTAKGWLAAAATLTAWREGAGENLPVLDGCGLEGWTAHSRGRWHTAWLCAPPGCPAQQWQAVRDSSANKNGISQAHAARRTSASQLQQQQRLESGDCSRDAAHDLRTVQRHQRTGKNTVALPPAMVPGTSGGISIATVMHGTQHLIP